MLLKIGLKKEKEKGGQGDGRLYLSYKATDAEPTASHDESQAIDT